MKTGFYETVKHFTIYFTLKFFNVYVATIYHSICITYIFLINIFTTPRLKT